MALKFQVIQRSVSVNYNYSDIEIKFDTINTFEAEKKRIYNRPSFYNYKDVYTQVGIGLPIHYHSDKGEFSLSISPFFSTDFKASNKYNTKTTVFSYIDYGIRTNVSVKNKINLGFDVLKIDRYDPMLSFHLGFTTDIISFFKTEE